MIVFLNLNIHWHLLHASTAPCFDSHYRVNCTFDWQMHWMFCLQLVNPKLSIKSRKAPAPEGFVLHSSKLEELKNAPFLIHWNNGLVKSVYVNQNEVISLVNLKKGVASLFQVNHNMYIIITVNSYGEKLINNRCAVLLYCYQNHSSCVVIWLFEDNKHVWKPLKSNLFEITYCTLTLYLSFIKCLYRDVEANFNRDYIVREEQKFLKPCLCLKNRFDYILYIYFHFF